MPSPRYSRPERGLTMVELMIVSVILLVLAGAIGAMAIRGQDAQDYVARQTTVTTTTQDIVERIRVDASSSSRLFGLGGEGDDYWARLDRKGFGAIAGTRLPRIASDAIFDKDEAGSEKTGNALMFALHDRTDTFDVAQNPSAPEWVRVDVYRIVAYYMHSRPGHDPAVDVDGLDLVRWVSPPLANHGQVEEILDLDKRAALLAHLWSGSNPANSRFPFPPARLLWRPGAPFDDAFVEVKQDGTTQPVVAGFELPPDAKQTRRSLLGYRHLSVSGNAAGPARGIAKFGLVQSTGDGFPHGFETQIVGPASARQVLVHLTVVSNHEGRHRAWLDVTGVAETRDL